jgi:hypothetical protein
VHLCLDSHDGSPRVPAERIHDLPRRSRAALDEALGLESPADAVHVMAVVARCLSELIVVEWLAGGQR